MSNILDNIPTEVNSLLGAVFGTEVQQKGKLTAIVGSIVSIGAPNGSDSFFFTEFELPSRLSFGHKQIGVVHNFTDGGRAVDLYGAQPHAITLTGELFDLPFDVNTPERQIKTNGRMRNRHDPGESAMQRMAKLDALCVKGSRVLFQFHEFKFYCVVMDAQFEAEHWHDVHYTLQLEVLEDNIDQKTKGNAQRAAKLNPPPHKNLLNQFIEATKAMQSVITKVTLVQRSASAVITSLKRDPGSILLAGAQMLPGGVEVTNLIASSQRAISSGSALMADVYPQLQLDMRNAQPYETLDNDAYLKYLIPTTIAAREAVDDMNDYALNWYPKLTSTANAVEPVKPDPALVALMARDGRNASARLAQMQKTMLKIVKPKRMVRLTVVNPNLAKVALEVYNDAQLWRVLAAVNGLKDMVNTGTYVLQIPYLSDISYVEATLTPAPSAGT